MTRLLGGGLAPDLADLVELGLHHEQQHQELLLMDIKHVLSCNPAPARLRHGHGGRTGGRQSGGPVDRASRAGWSRWATTDRGFAFDNEAPAMPSTWSPSRWPTGR